MLYAFCAVVDLVEILKMVYVVHDDAHTLRTNVGQHVSIDFGRAHNCQHVRFNHYVYALCLRFSSDFSKRVYQLSPCLRRPILSSWHIRPRWIEAPRANQAAHSVELARYLNAAFDLFNNALPHRRIRIKKTFTKANAKLNEIHLYRFKRLPHGA